MTKDGSMANRQGKKSDMKTHQVHLESEPPAQPVPSGIPSTSVGRPKKGEEAKSITVHVACSHSMLRKVDAMRGNRPRSLAIYQLANANLSGERPSPLRAELLMELVRIRVDLHFVIGEWLMQGFDLEVQFNELNAAIDRLTALMTIVNSSDQL